jgi:hypothetical protein
MDARIEKLIYEIGKEELLKQLNEQPNKKEQTAKEWLTDILLKLEINKDMTTPDNVYWNIGDDFMFNQDFKNGYLYYNYFKIWKVLNSKYLINNEKINQLINTTVKDVLKWSGLTPKKIKNIKTNKL